MPRLYPALDLIWSVRPDDERLELLIAEVDPESPTAVEERADRLRIFFPSAAARHHAGVRLVALESDLTCEPIDVPDEDWAERSQATLGPVHIGRIVVGPPWVPAEPAGGRLWITIRPSMGFGTAHHASTRLCLRLLQDLPVGGRHLLDVGTGSGVLAIAAARLGASDVLAIDHDADALASARENVELNAVEAVTLEQVDLIAIVARIPFDLILANLTGATLMQHGRALARLLAPGGSLVASGFELSEADAVTQAFVSVGLTQSAALEEDGWSAARFTSPTPSTRR